MTFNPFSLEDKRILVTGASSGIGRQIAIGCAGMGATVILTGRDSMRLEETRQQMGEGSHQIHPADLLDEQSLDRLAQATGVLHGLVHAAGIAKLVPFRQISKRHLDEVLGVNLYAPLLLTRSLLAKRAIAPGGSIVFIGSIASEIGPMATAVYAGGKAALLGAARSLAQEVAKQRIRANVISPGYVRTPLLEQLGTSGANLDSLVSLGPLGLGEPEDVANAAVFFLSDATRWVTRSRFVIDGGFTVPMSV